MELMVVATLAIVFYFGYLTVRDLLDDCRREGLLEEVRYCGNVARGWSNRLVRFANAEKVVRRSLRVTPCSGTAAVVRVMQNPITCRLSRNCWR
ncbi:hypothetical protein GMLC_23520 [Geomonas limicola]|uniref:Uncharacterized protein n=1 Tax=Geomonas limicola TaxID=2740186 RepID=A0A6V8NB58_9BACT|nr:hypothetical protein [Geomonas limicola]GFO68773.1 hypothetical protein GMLC_23520 [Geomonas limicola]